MTYQNTLSDISLWLAGTSIIILITAELISPRYGRMNLPIEKGRMKQLSYILGILFLITVALRIYLQE